MNRKSLFSWLMCAAVSATSAFSSQEPGAALDGGTGEATLEELKQIVAGHVSATNVLDRHYLEVVSEGESDVPFDIVRDLTPETVFVSKVAEMLALADFSISPTDREDAYLFCNTKGETSDVFILSRVADENECVSVAYVTGTRFFGSFGALIHVRTSRLEKGVRYSVHLYAYPEGSIVRFAARNIGIIRRYFRSNALEIVDAATKASRRIAADPAHVLKEVLKHRDPDQPVFFTDREERFLRHLYGKHNMNVSATGTDDNAM